THMQIDYTNQLYDLPSTSHNEIYALHSVPTRRSSDLGAGTRGPLRLGSDPALHPGLLAANGSARPVRPLWGADLLRPPPGRRRRSEEHTSELQSLRQLVCRLLLEKKKHAFMRQQHASR